VSAPPGHRGARRLLSESLRRDLVQAMGPYRTPQGSGRPATVRSKRPPHVCPLSSDVRKTNSWWGSLVLSPGLTARGSECCIESSY
jgi:hypothetical protein